MLFFSLSCQSLRDIHHLFLHDIAAFILVMANPGFYDSRMVLCDAKTHLQLMDKSLCLHRTTNTMMEVTEKAGNGSGGCLKDEMGNEVKWAAQGVVES